MNNKRSMSTRNLVLCAVLAALIIPLQMMANNVQLFGTSINLVLVPIVIGAAVIGPSAGAILGLISALTILLHPVAREPFFSWTPLGTTSIILLKGILSGFFAGLIYKFLKRKNQVLAVYSSAAICPIVNTGIFIIGCFSIFMPYINENFAGLSNGKFSNATAMIFLGWAGVNFIFELVINIILSPIIVRLLKIKKA